MTERRYTEAEVAAIFERAARRQDSVTPERSPSDGMTLAQIRDIGREVGIPDRVIDESAMIVAQQGNTTERRFLGFPLGVGRTVPLPRKLSEEEWERVIVDLRETFDARGRVRAEGSLRQWTNGNLQVLLEPTASAQQLRIRTTKGQAISLLGLGASLIGITAIGVALMLATHDVTAGRLSAISMFGAFGVALIGYALVPLRAWARARTQQMEDIAGRVAALTSEPPSQ